MPTWLIVVLVLLALIAVWFAISVRSRSAQRTVAFDRYRRARDLIANPKHPIDDVVGASYRDEIIAKLGPWMDPARPALERLAELPEPHRTRFTAHLIDGEDPLLAEQYAEFALQTTAAYADDDPHREHFIRRELEQWMVFVAKALIRRYMVEGMGFEAARDRAGAEVDAFVGRVMPWAAVDRPFDAG